ncbi:hypothetical protein D3C80_1568590 [compost metagenome]
MDIPNLGGFLLLIRDLLPFHFRAQQQMRRFHIAVVNQGGHRFHDLYWRCGPVALTDPHRNGVTLIPGFLEAFKLPVAVWHIAAALFRQIDAAVMTVSEFAHPF